MELAIALLVIGAIYVSNKAPTAPAGTVTDGQGPQCGGVGGFIKGHLGRKNAIAPKVISKYTGAGGSTADTIAKYANEFSLSNKVEGFVDDKLGNALCNLNPLEAAAAGAKFVGGKIVEGAEYVGHGIVSGAEYVGSGIASGAKSVGSAAAAGAKFGAGLVTNPLSGVQKANTFGTKVALAPLALSSRATTAAYNALPTPLKVVAAPAVIPFKVTAKVATTVIKGVGTVASGAGRTLSSGVKSAEHAVSSVASGIGHALGF